MLIINGNHDLPIKIQNDYINIENSLEELEKIGFLKYLGRELS